MFKFSVMSVISQIISHTIQMAEKSEIKLQSSFSSTYSLPSSQLWTTFEDQGQTH